MYSGVSIIVCSYNGATRLPETLRHIAAQKLDDSITLEVIVVNNNSSDNTVQVATQVWQELASNIHFLIIDEPKPGKSFALAAGYNAANFEYLIVCDDDNWLDEKYVQIVYETMLHNPRIGVLGGRSEAVFEVEPPAWFKEYEGAYAVGKQADRSGDISTSRGFVWGAGMVIRKKTWQDLIDFHFESILPDRKGKDLSSGGDRELCVVIRFLGYEIYYDENLFLRHFIPSRRLEWQYLKKLIFSFEEGELIFSMYQFVEDTYRNKADVNYEDWWRKEKNKYYNLLADELKIKGWWKRIIMYCFSDIEGERYMLNYMKLFCNIPYQPTIPVEYKNLIHKIEKLYSRIQSETAKRELIKAV